eukprot:1185720-Prorocentrum_minimum.AAC.1
MDLIRRWGRSLSPLGALGQKLSGTWLVHTFQFTGLAPGGQEDDAPETPLELREEYCLSYKTIGKMPSEFVEWPSTKSPTPADMRVLILPGNPGMDGADGADVI